MWCEEVTKHQPARTTGLSKLTERHDPARDVVLGDGLHCHPFASPIRSVNRSVVDLSVQGPLWKEQYLKSNFRHFLTVTMKSLYMLPAPPLDSILTVEQHTTERPV